MIISTQMNNQAYLTTQNTVTADVNKPNTAVNNIDERVNAVVEEDSKQSTLKIAERLAERSNQPALQQKEAQNSLASQQNADKVLSELEVVATKLNEAAEADEVVSSNQSKEKVTELRAELKDLAAQLKDVQSETEPKAGTEGKEVKVRFNSSEISSLAETLSKIELAEDSTSVKEQLSGEKGLVNEIAKTRSELQASLQDANSPQITVDNRSAQQSSEASKNSINKIPEVILSSRWIR